MTQNAVLCIFIRLQTYAFFFRALKTITQDVESMSLHIDNNYIVFKNLRFETRFQKFQNAFVV